MIILSLDTTTRTGSMAVLRDGAVLHEVAGEPEITHGQRLPADLTRVLEDAGLRLEDVELFAVAAGPGSFTGLRVGIATVQGLAMATGRLVVPVSTLDSLGWAGANASRPVAAWMDAQRGEVFAALYSPDGRDQLIAPTNASPSATLESWGAGVAVAGATFIGDGAVRYADVIRAAEPDARIILSPLLAGVIGAIAADDRSRAVLPHAVVPIYIRRPDAELARARRATAAVDTPSPYKIERLSGDQDLDAVAALEAESFTNPWTRDMLAQELSRSDVARVYVLRASGRRVIAFCACWVVVDELHINTVAVDPGSRRQGLATLLLRHVLADAAEAGAERATLEVRRSNDPALRLYESLGFAVEAVRTRYYREPEEDALVLWRRNPGPAHRNP